MAAGLWPLAVAESPEHLNSMLDALARAAQRHLPPWGRAQFDPNELRLELGQAAAQDILQRGIDRLHWLDALFQALDGRFNIVPRGAANRLMRAVESEGPRFREIEVEFTETDTTMPTPEPSALASAMIAKARDLIDSDPRLGFAARVLIENEPQRDVARASGRDRKTIQRWTKLLQEKLSE